MNRENLNDRAVSEVFGVMLILTITLIVACIVATFVCGFSFDAKKDAISANIVASDLYMDESDESCAYILFDHLSGDPVDLNDIRVSLGIRSSAKMTTCIRNVDHPTGLDEAGNSLTCYIANYGEDSSKITVGDRFVLYADGIDKNGIFWMRENTSEKFSAPMNDYITYQIIDTRSNRPISTGSIPVSHTG
ncbi:type IV pilin [Methanogenium cariaci]|jgi:archaeal type IV pilus assembly protein PilA